MSRMMSRVWEINILDKYNGKNGWENFLPSKVTFEDSAHLRALQSALHFGCAALAWPAALIGVKGVYIMSERMQDYRDRMEAKGLVQVRVWVDKQDEGFVKLIAKFCRDGRKKKAKVRFGRPASDYQIQP